MKMIDNEARTQPQEKHILYGIIALVCITPLPFGSDRAIPIAVIIAVTGFLSIYWGLFAAKNPRFVRVSLKHIKWLTIAVTVVLLWALLQAMPLNIEGISNEFWKTAQLLLPEQHIKSSISVTPRESWIGLYKILAYVMIFWLALQICKSSNNCKRILRSLSISGGIYALYGLSIKITGNHKILWFDKIYYLDSVSSTFVNRNNYATYIGVVIIISMALFIQKLLENISSKRKRDVYGEIIQRLFTTNLPLMIGIFIMLSSLILSNSRAGIAVSIMAFSVFVLLSTFTKEMKQYRKIFIAITAIVIGCFLFLFIVGGDLVASRFDNFKKDAILRGMIYSSTIDAIADFPLTGTGLGSFTDVFKAYRNDSFPAFFRTLTTRAHNSYLELMLELGIPAAILLIGIFTMLWLKTVRGVWTRRKNGYIPAISTSACLLIGTHSLFDFSAQIPAITILLVVLLAMGLVQSWSSKYNTSAANIENRSLIIYHKIAAKSSIIIGIILIISSMWQVYVYSYESTPSMYKDNALALIDIANKEDVLTTQGTSFLHRAEANLKNSLTLEPVDPYAWSYLAYIRLLTEDNSKTIIDLLSASISSGTYQHDLEFFRTGLIPVVWNDANQEEQDMLAYQIRRSWVISPTKTMKVLNDPLARSLLKEIVSTMPDSDKHLKIFNVLDNK